VPQTLAPRVILVPQARRGDPAAWRTALDNANAQLEHQLNRIANLELLLKFGPNTWRAQAALSAAAAKQLESQLADTRKQVGPSGRGDHLCGSASEIALIN
jgi:pre-mRNA-splicing factor SPF27